MASRKARTTGSSASKGALGDEHYRRVVAAHAGQTGVTESKMFGSPGLKIRGKVFAILWRGHLVVKLPAPRVDELLTGGRATRFDPGMGRQMKEWVELPPDDVRHWLALAEESRAFVGRG